MMCIKSSTSLSVVLSVRAKLWSWTEIIGPLDNKGACWAVYDVFVEYFLSEMTVIYFRVLYISFYFKGGAILKNYKCNVWILGKRFTLISVAITHILLLTSLK